MSRKVLLIVEGEADEIRFFRQLFKCCYQKLDFYFYSYRTNLHVLAQELFNNYPNFENEDIDIRLVLASLEKDDNKKKLLRDNYSDIFMIFDFEPQDLHTHYDTIRRMLAYFSDSTEQGKLFINYPMMQSYKHFSDLPDDLFDQKAVSLDQVKSYKALVAAESAFTDLQKYDFRTFYSIAYHHIKKALFVQTENSKIPTLDMFFSLDYQAIYDKQVQFVDLEKMVWVLNTCIIGVVEFSPRKFFDYVNKHKTELQI